MGAGHGGARRSVVAQTAFCQLRHFCEVLRVLRRRSRRRTGGCCHRHRPQLFLPSLLPVSACVSLAGRVCVRVGARKPGPFGSFILSSPVPRPNCATHRMDEGVRARDKMMDEMAANTKDHSGKRGPGRQELRLKEGVAPGPFGSTLPSYLVSACLVF